ncbi:hypothetical protein K0B96_04510 [Horticoccus luteus]|uniref:Uncharacterized protein n=1 Tax=Horticoccus luteus TaxID=2862869 RepID=A0A8F9TZA0_9BACT|nr:hypothetical protein K0B96_04510 [Horticoccus luteus]
MESAFLAEASARGEAVTPAQPTDNASREPLPGLDELVQRVPVEVRAVLDELFRARFVSVQRVPESALKRG